MDQQKRLLIAIGLSLGLTMVFTKLVWEPQAEAERAKQAALLDAGLAELPDGGAAPVAAIVAALDAGLDTDGGALAVAPATDAPLREVKVERPSTNLVFTSEGAGLTDAVLRGRREHYEQQLSIPDGYKKLFGTKFPPPPQVDLADPSPAGPPQLGISIAGASPLLPRARYAVVEEAPGKLVFSTTQGPWEVTKTFTFNPTVAPPADKEKVVERNAAPYALTLEVKVKNVSGAPQAGELLVHATRAIDPEHEQGPSMFGGIGNQAIVKCGVGDSLKEQKPNDEKPLLEEKGSLHFVAIDQQYFLSAVWPMDGAVDGRCLLNATSTVRSADLALPLTLAAGETTSKRFGVFLGPKDLELLNAIAHLEALPGAPASTFNPGLDKTVDFGWWAFICKGLLFFLRLFHILTGNWGIAIILLTVMVKVLLLPLTHKAMVSAEQMKKLQPRIEEIRKKFPDDREKQNVEMMRLYSEAKVNPLGGCLPLLLQMPIWIALFTTLRTSYELYGEPFFGVWSDLTSKDPTYLLPLALGVTMIITQRLQPQMMDKSQAVLMTWVMPVFFTALMMNYPAGLALYIFTNNLLSIAQQFALRKYLERSGQAAPKVQKSGAGR